MNEYTLKYVQTAGGSQLGKTISHSGTCDACETTNNGVIYDANVRTRWGWLCPSCFRSYRCSLGVGKGQRYVIDNGVQFFSQRS
jgi:hypothetical protein